MTKIKAWNYLYKSSLYLVDSLDFNIQNNLNNQFGTYLYVPPINENWLNKRCYTDLVSVEQCDLNHELEYTCNNLRAAYGNVFGNIYNNVVCKLCTGIKADDISTTCKLSSIKEPGSPRLTMLLNKEVIDIPNLSDMQTAKEMMTAKSYCQPNEDEKVE
jgi:hypothetical protein